MSGPMSKPVSRLKTEPMSRLMTRSMVLDLKSSGKIPAADGTCGKTTIWQSGNPGGRQAGNQQAGRPASQQGWQGRLSISGERQTAPPRNERHCPFPASRQAHRPASQQSGQPADRKASWPPNLQGAPFRTPQDGHCRPLPSHASRIIHAENQQAGRPASQRGRQGRLSITGERQTAPPEMNRSCSSVAQNIIDHLLCDPGPILSLACQPLGKVPSICQVFMNTVFADNFIFVVLSYSMVILTRM
ncbi:uncharacterized protein LOC131196860 [Ahaetulla prasina]|uniref:uncharacterized protein LOC131196860 n=1 Tax=Ahaetulla prasina TaxID=499056 RepID=UPI00264A0570|nr:uncharacterized protein LOC131196860 [Ahaetulla prasina]